MGNNTEDLKSAALFKNFSAGMLEEFSKFFKQTKYDQDAVIFKEKSSGDTLFIIVDGEIAIEKRLDEEGREFKQLAILSKGEFFGEMAVIEGQTRFAQARATKAAVLYEIKREEFFSFIKQHPETGISVFIEIMKSLLKRLQHTSSELTMLFDMSKFVMEEHASSADFVKKAVEEISLYFEGSWNINGYMYNQFNDEYEQVIAKETFKRDASADIPKGDKSSGWLDGSAYLMNISGHKGNIGYIVFARSEELTNYEKNNLATIFNTISSILGSAIENIEHRTEAALLAKLRTQKNFL